MKAKLSTIICLTLCLLLCSAAALAADHSATATIDLVFDGMTFTDSVQVEWNERYVVPEGGIDWNGDPDFLFMKDYTVDDIITLPSEDLLGNSYVKNQIAFTALPGKNFDSIEQIAAKHGARIVGYLSPTENYVIECLEDKTYEQLQATIAELKEENFILPETVNLRYVYRITQHAYPNDPWGGADWSIRQPSGYNWGAEAIRAPLAWNYSNLMTAMNVGLIDTTFLEGHPDISFSASYDRVDPAKLNDNFIAWVTSELDILKGQLNHGTHVAGTFSAKYNNEIGLSGIYPKGSVIGIGCSYQLDDYLPGDNINEIINHYINMYSDTSTDMFYFLTMRQHDVRVINMSMGYSYDKDGIAQLKNADDTTIKEWFESRTHQWSVEYGWNEFFNRLNNLGYEFVLVWSAGNDEYDCRMSYWPAWIDNEFFQKRLIVVGSCDIGMEYSDVNFGERLDIIAPGENIYSAYVDKDGNYVYETMSGTSMATPHVSGVTAMVWSLNSSLNGAKVKEIICDRNNRSMISDGHNNQRPFLDAYACVQTALGIGTITGKVESNLIGLAGIEIEMKNSGTTATLVTDQNGFFTADLPVGTYTLCIDSENYEPIQRIVQIISGKDAEELVVLEGNGGNTNVGNFTCTVLDKNTQNPLNANVKLVPTNNSGVINVEGIGVSGVMNMELDVGSYDLIVSMDGYYAYTETVTISEDADVRVIIELEPTEAPEIKKGTLNGTVKHNSNGMSGIKVDITSGTTSVATLITDEAGQFAVDLEPGTYVLSINEDGYVPVNKNIIILLGKTTNESIELSLLSTINGVVKERNGAVLEQVKVSVEEKELITQTDKNGVFSIKGLAAGAEHVLKFEKSGYQTVSVEVTLDDDSETILDTVIMEKLPAAIGVGDYLTLGKYLGEPIVWRCVGIDNNGPLMLSDKILCFKAFDVAGNYSNYLRKIHGSNHWETSSLKHWLNSKGTVNWNGRASVPNNASCFDGYNDYDTEVGFLSFFTEEEQALIKYVTQKTYLHHLEQSIAAGGTDALRTGGNSTFSEFIADMSNKTANKWYYNSQEYFFVMGPEQVKMVCDNIGSNYLMAQATTSAREDDESKTTTQDVSYKYWLRLPCNEGANYENVRIVDSTQRIYYAGVRGAVDGENYHSIGVRPAFYLNVSE